MKELTALLEQLAVKLGTTVEHLWGVLLRQARISGTIEIVIDIVLIAASMWVFRFVQKKTKDGKDGYAEWDGEGKFFGWLGVAIFVGMAGVQVLHSLEGIISAFLNPEYWALKQILK